MAPGHCQAPRTPDPYPAASLELLFALVSDANTTPHPKATGALGGSPMKLFLSILDGTFVSAPSQGVEEGETNTV